MSVGATFFILPHRFRALCCFATAAAAPWACAVVYGEVLGHELSCRASRALQWVGWGECGMGVTHLRQIDPEFNLSPQAVVEHLQPKHGR